MKKSYALQGLFILFGWLFFFSCKRESISVPANDTSRPTIAELLLQWKPDVQNDFKMEQLGVSAAGNPLSNARKASSFTILNAALAKTGVLNDLKRSGAAYTLFAPDDEAFANSGLTRQEVNKIPKDELAKILRYHILSQKVGSAAIPSAVNPYTQQGNRVFIRKISSNVYVNLAKVIQTDIPASNGILHIIDKVLIPQVKNLKEIVATDPQFSLLAQALNTAKTAAINVDSFLTSEGPNTLFAPANTAFEQAGLNSDSLAKLDPEEIAGLLAYHMTSGAVFSIDILEDIEPLMLSGEQTAITVNGGIRIQGTLNDESIPLTETDRLATNGVIHVITDRILAPSLGSVRDNSGNVYKTIRICNQVWMAENLRTSRYRNNDAIPNVTAANNWLALTTGAWCNYDNAAANDAVYGKLYNSFAIQDTRSLAPRGWHIPSSDEWETLFACLGNKSIAGGKMKAVSNLWLAPNTAATNSSGFTGLPGGLRTNVDGGGGFAKLNSDAWFAFANPTGVGYFNLYYTTESVNNTNLFGYYNWFSQTTGVSVRCVKD